MLNWYTSLLANLVFLYCETNFGWECRLYDVERQHNEHGKRTIYNISKILLHDQLHHRNTIIMLFMHYADGVSMLQWRWYLHSKLGLCQKWIYYGKLFEYKLKKENKSPISSTVKLVMYQWIIFFFLVYWSFYYCNH